MVSLIQVLLPLCLFILSTLIWFFYFEERWLIGGNQRGFGPLILHIIFSISIGFVGFTIGTIISWFL
jgi:hypothetical protein